MLIAPFPTTDPDPVPTAEPAPTEKECSFCKEVKPLDQFYNYYRGKYGKQSRCKACPQGATKEAQREASRRYRDKQQGKIPTPSITRPAPHRPAVARPNPLAWVKDEDRISITPFD